MSVRVKTIQISCHTQRKCLTFIPIRMICSQLLVKQNAKELLRKFWVFLIADIAGLKGYKGNILSWTPENLPVKRCTQFKVATSVRPEGIKGQTRRQVYRREVGFSAAFFLSYPGNKFSSRPAASWNSGTML